MVLDQVLVVCGADGLHSVVDQVQVNPCVVYTLQYQVLVINPCGADGLLVVNPCGAVYTAVDQVLVVTLVVLMVYTL